tara:strand:- start:187 stop:3669 length:3483 start_codon:yes stop_codon:yes gene_type:complete
MPLSKLQFRPGINNDITSYSNEGGWRDGDKVRFRLGFPEKIGGWEKYSSSTYLGTARALHNWIALDGSDFLGVGTHLKYYIEEGESFNDITPIRSTTTLGEVTFSATNGSGTITVNQTNHGANQNDFVTFTNAEGLGGNVTAAILNAEHQVARVINSASYEIFINDFVKTFTEVTQDATSGTGSGAEFTVTTDGNGGYTVSSVTLAGTGYAPNDTITVNGANLGGATTANNLTITVATVTNGGITTVTSAGTSRTATAGDSGVGGNGVGNVNVSGTGVVGTGVKTVTVGAAGTGVGALTFSSPSSDGVGNVTISGASTGSATTTGVVQTSSTGNGSGATFTVVAGSGNYTVTVTAVGSGYVVGEEIVIEGQNLGGTKGTNDLTLTITHLAGSSVGSTTHNNVAQTSTSGSGSNAQFSVTTDGNGGYSLSTSAVGSNYAVNDTITIAGTSVGGATPANDIVLTVTQLSRTSIGADTFTGVEQTSTSGSGSGAKFTITTDGQGGYTVDAVTTAGSGYAVNDTITIAGNNSTGTNSSGNTASLGGGTPANDLVLTITDMISVTYESVAQTSTNGSGSGAKFTITANGSGVYSVAAITDIGTGYANGNTITIAGTSLGGATPANDLTLTITALSHPTIADYQINVGQNTTIGGTGWGAGPFGGVAGHTPASTTLNGATTTTANTITLTSTTGFPTSGFAVILVAQPGTSEVIQYTGISGNDLTGCTRGLFSTPAAAHANSTTIQEATYGWGIPSSLTTTTQIRLWSHDNFGEDLLINPRDSKIFYWERSTGIGARAVELSTIEGTKTSVPQICKQIMVSDRDRHVLAFGCDAINADPTATLGDGVQDPLLIRFSSQESATTWFPSATNTAGDLRLGSGSTFVRAIETKREILVWTDTALSSLRFIGPPFTFGLQQLANNITIAGPNAVAATEDFVFWMGIDNFYVYAGQTTQLPCTVKDHVFQNIDLEQLDKVYAGVNSEYGEAIWLYPSSGSTENDRYVIYNYLDKIWYYGTLSRTAWLDRGTRNFPLATEGGYLYNHEFGNDDDGSAMTSFIESAVMDIEDGDRFLYIRRIVPDLTFSGSTALSTPQATFTIKARDFPGSNFNNTGSGTAIRTQVTPVEEYTDQAHARIRGRSFAFRVESTALGSKWKLGSPRVDIRPDGRR